MKKLSAILLVSCLFFSGCSSVPQEAFDQATTNALISDSFVERMEAGNTTRDQEQSFIRASRKAWHTQNFALNEVPVPAELRGE